MSVSKKYYNMEEDLDGGGAILYIEESAQIGTILKDILIFLCLATFTNHSSNTSILPQKGRNAVHICQLLSNMVENCKTYQLK
jgi:hypothetical protein